MNELDLRALRNGDRHAYRTAVARYHPTLLRLALIYSPSRAGAEQAVRETWAAVLRGLDGFRRGSSFRIWLCRLLLAAAGRTGTDAPAPPFSGEFTAVSPDLFFKNGLWVGRWNVEREDWSRLPEERLRSTELRDVAADAVGRLPAEQREVILLRDVEGWSAAEVTELLSISDETQRALLHRARSRVRQALQDHLAPTALN